MDRTGTDSRNQPRTQEPHQEPPQIGIPWSWPLMPFGEKAREEKGQKGEREKEEVGVPFVGPRTIGRTNVPTIPRKEKEERMELRDLKDLEKEREAREWE